MSLVTPPTTPNVASSYVMPGKLTYFPDGSYSVEKASYYSQQQLPSLTANDAYSASPFVVASPMAKPRESKGQQAVKAAFNPRDLAIDAGIGGIATLVWSAFRRGNLVSNLFLIPLMMAFGAGVRGFVTGIGGYNRN